MQMGRVQPLSIHFRLVWTGMERGWTLSICFECVWMWMGRVSPSCYPLVWHNMGCSLSLPFNVMRRFTLPCHFFNLNNNNCILINYNMYCTQHPTWFLTNPEQQPDLSNLDTGWVSNFLPDPNPNWTPCTPKWAKAEGMLVQGSEQKGTWK